MVVASFAIIGCSKRKRTGGECAYEASRTRVERLPEGGRDRLMGSRRELGALLGLAPGPDLGSDVGAGATLFLPACHRYSGIIYTRAGVSRRPIQLLLRSVVIVSALYGLVAPDESIRDYDLTMSGRLPDGRAVWRWWRDRGLGQLVTEYVAGTSEGWVVDLLSHQYRRALEPWPPSDASTLVLAHESSGPGMSSLYRRADQLASVLDASRSPERGR